ncbi:tetratricopeptide repeat protein [Bacillus sp. SG-1]|uniref:tetratricopeptide repeat protein n=1 Tax=Bacillus sp. SG-1 TaxID=161544 RepID=UPI00030649ED|nr:tetratricopeptide repeat protein [Bacillus sp. SG-1]
MLSEALSKMVSKDYKEAKVMFETLVNDSPEDPLINFYCGSVNDALGLEKAAIPFYRRALENGVTGEIREAAFIQLGSSYRCIGEYPLAKDVLTNGLAEFPDNPALKVFYAMTLYNMGEHKESFTLMLKTLMSNSSDEWLKKYDKALRFYSEDIDGVWE